AIAKILRQLLKRTPRPEGASVFAQPHHIAKIALSRPSRFVAWQPGRQTLLRFFGEMKRQFVAHLLFLAAALQPPGKLPKERDHSPSSWIGFRRKPIART